MIKPLTVRIRRGPGLVFYQQVTVFKGISRLAPPPSRTPDQAAARNFLGRSKQAWALCSPAQKAQWSAFAQKQFRVNRRDFPKMWRGIDAFSRASVARQIAGLDPMPLVPEDDLPEGATRMLLFPGANARELVFTMQHDHSSSEGLALLVRLTPTGPTPGRNPYQRNLRHARGTGQQSVLPLPASGEVVRMPDVRFALQAGHRYAVELRVLRLADGAVSDAYYQVGVREQETETKAEALTHRHGGTEERRKKAEEEYLAQRRERRKNVKGIKAEADAEALTRRHGGTEEKLREAKTEEEASECGGGEGFQDDNVNVIILTPETHPELWRWQDGYNKYFPQWNCMEYYKAQRMED
jgi:hypothetical protein